MWVIIISSSALALLLSLCCFSGSINEEKTKRQQLKWIKGEKRYYFDEELEKSFYQRFIFPLWKNFLNSAAKISKTKRKESLKIKERNIKMLNELRLAGIRMSVQEFMFLRMIGTVGILAFGLIFAFRMKVEAMIQFLVLLFVLIAAILIPRYILKSRIKSRQLAIQNELPNVLDVLSVSIEAGLGFDAALLRVIERFNGPLIEEFAQVSREVQMGKARRDSLSALSQRSNVPELQTFASAVVQAEQFGTPMKNVLRTQAQQLRVARRQQAQEKGMKAPVKMMMPTVFFIFPVIFIILLGPMVINLVLGN